MSRHAGAPAPDTAPVPAFTLTISRTWLVVVVAVITAVVALVLAVIPVATATAPVQPTTCSTGR